jgi:hypothetical protein
MKKSRCGICILKSSYANAGNKKRECGIRTDVCKSSFADVPIGTQTFYTKRERRVKEKLSAESALSFVKLQECGIRILRS